MKIESVKLGKDCESVEVKFRKGEKKGKFIYRFYGGEGERGIEWCNYEEDGNEDIYADIHDWVGEHMEAYTQILYDGKELK